MPKGFGNIVLNQWTITLTGLKTLNNSKPRALTPEGESLVYTPSDVPPLDWPGQATRESYAVTGNMDQKRNNCPVNFSAQERKNPFYPPLGNNLILLQQ